MSEVLMVKVDSTEHLAMPFIIHERATESALSQLSHSGFMVQPVAVTVLGSQSGAGSASVGEVMPAALVLPRARARESTAWGETLLLPLGPSASWASATGSLSLPSP
ncbi:MAG: hypothetical protein QM820_42305 [Minicystis sp.]